ncbi:MAG: FxsA family protein [Alphaproteobacteria bacterium]
MGLILAVLFIGLPIAEIATFIQVGDLIGLWPTLLAIVGTGVLGTILVRIQGLQTLRQVQASLDRGEAPVAELFGGLALLLAGVMLLLPGFITDALGFLLLIPPLRRSIGVALLRWLTRDGRMRVWRGGGRADGRTGGVVIDAEYVEIRDPADPAPPAQQLPEQRLPDGRDGDRR